MKKKPQKPIPAHVILMAEASRLELLSHTVPEKSEQLFAFNCWAHRLSAAFLESLGAPERLVRYVPAENIDAILAKIEGMDAQAIRLLCGEMTAQEMRTAKAILAWVAREIKQSK